MASNEERAKLCGWEPTANGWVYVDKDGFYPCPAYDTSLDACAELLRFVRKRGKEFYFVRALERTTGYGGYQNSDRSVENGWNALTATPQQLCAAFDAVFKDELEKIQ